MILICELQSTPDMRDSVLAGYCYRILRLRGRLLATDIVEREDWKCDWEVPSFSARGQICPDRVIMKRGKWGTPPGRSLLSSRSNLLLRPTISGSFLRRPLKRETSRRRDTLKLATISGLKCLSGRLLRAYSHPRHGWSTVSLLHLTRSVEV
jgi:hypothetical protein